MARKMNFSKAEIRQRAPLALAVIACIIVTVVLPDSGLGHYMRIVLGGVSIFFAPGWYLANWLPQSRSLLERTVLAVVISATYLAVLGVMAEWGQVRVTTTLFASVSVPLVIVLAMLTPPPHTHARDWLPVVLCGVAIAVAAGSTILVHETLPRVPVESTYSIEAPKIRIVGKSAYMNVVITRVRYPEPITLKVSINYVAEKTFDLGGKTGTLHLVFPFPHPGHCYTSTVQVETQNGQYLTPPLVCPRS